MADLYLKSMDIPATGNTYKLVQPDGYYPDMTAGQITTNIHDTNSVPYLFRPTPYNSTRESGDIVGASVAWNQLCNGSSVTVPNGHKYYLSKGGTKSIGASNGSAITGLTSGTDMVVDLTLALGSTIADYLYTLESGTAGAGIAKLREWGFFTKPYYAYNASGIESVNVSKHIMRDGDDNIIGEYPLDYSLTLRGILKLDGSNNLYADGDTYEADGTVTRRYGIVDLGTLTWSNETGTSNTLFLVPKARLESVGIYIKATSSNAGVANLFCGSLQVASQNDVFNSRVDKSIAIGSGGALRVIDTSYTDADTFKAAMSGVMLVYELATPTTETADPYNEVQVCSPYGTEEFVDAGVAAGTRDVSIPVGNVTAYMKNIVGAIEGIPLPPSANGTYTLKVTVASGVPTYSWVSE